MLPPMPLRLPIRSSIISQLACPGMMVEVDVTAFIPKDRTKARVIVAPNTASGTR